MFPPEVTRMLSWSLMTPHTEQCYTEANMATATAGEVTGSPIYGLMLKTMCGSSWQICERVMLKRRKRRKEINTLMMSLCGALAVCCCVLLQNNVKAALNATWLFRLRLHSKKSYMYPICTTFESGLNRIWKCQIQCDLCCSHCQKQIRYGSHLSKQIGFRSLLSVVWT